MSERYATVLAQVKELLEEDPIDKESILVLLGQAYKVGVYDALDDKVVWH
jgi:hypothetical protein